MSRGQGRENNGYWEEQLLIHSYDVNLSRRLTMESLLRYFQEAAWNHAEHLGRGYSHLLARNQVWVLSRMMVVVDSYPEWGETVLLRTWPCGSVSLLALRDFEMLDQNGGRLLGATTGWLVLDLQSRRPQRIEPILESISEFPRHRALEMEAPRLAAISVVDAGAGREVRYSDLDLNDHVNNAAYTRWILDTYPIDFHRAYRLRSIALNFLAEVGEDDSVIIRKADVEELRFAHTVQRSIDGTDVCRAELIWEPTGTSRISDSQLPADGTR
ncbi:MAG TPA: acyl-ACP thioesterase domain-containing protein [Acidobacteriota bacterium]|nr:acyl-ACP thioesterase domain-containing protein [Acidobacteriota bacterium]